jgi:transcriptional regulator with XRE-family HTH domain
MTSDPGQQLRRIRERLRLKYREVEEASLRIAARHKNPEFAIGLSRLADIENKGTVPSIYRIYSLATIYGLDYMQALAFYGVAIEQIPIDMSELELQVTRSIDLHTGTASGLDVPANLLGMTDFRRASILSREMQEWGLVPMQFLKTLDLTRYRYAFLGTEDWSMYPLIPPGSFVQIDETKRKIMNAGWDNDFSRPIYFLQLHDGYRFGWCTERAGSLIVQPHSAAPVAAEVFRYPGEVEVCGQVVAVAMRLDRAKPHRKRSS